MTTMMKSGHRHGWDDARAQEQAEIERRRGPERPIRDDLVGLAISGGGIRSATFGLGVLETLKSLGVLQKADYLSTVSGGGYIGAWLSANCHRNAGWLSPAADWLESISHLRRYSNYLSPKVGFFSADTWSMATIWLRNTLLIQTTVVLAIACALLVPRPLFELFQFWPQAGFLRWATILLFVFGVVGIAGNQMRLTAQGNVAFLKGSNWLLGAMVGGSCFAAAWAFGSYVDFDPFHSGRVTYAHAGPIAALLVLGGFALQPVAVKVTAAIWPWDDPPRQINYTQRWVQGAVVIPLMIAGFLVTAVLWGETVGTAPEGLATYVSYGSFLQTAWAYWPFPLSVVFASIWLQSFCAIRSWRNIGDLFIAFAAPFVAVPVLHALLCAVMALFHQWKRDPDGTWLAFVWGPPLIALAFVITIIVLVGMMSRQSTEDVREWWSRLGAWLGIYATAWMVLAVSAVYGPRLVQWALAEHEWGTMTAGGGWLGTVIAGLFAGNSEHTGTSRKKGMGTKAKEIVARAAPFVFIAGVLVAVAYGLESLIVLNGGGTWTRPAQPNEMFLRVSLGVGLGCLVGLLLLAWRVDINEFSLNAFYRNRLVRCYLGATRFQPNVRQPQNFTGFDDKDDLLLTRLADKKVASPGPLHIVNCALNLGGSSDLALHTRNSAAFTLSALFCGSGYQSRDQSGNTEQLGFVPTAKYGGHLQSQTLGQAIAVSGAAASPNMGYHTSPVVAFLMTLFNVRLGWWFQNPGRMDTGNSSPHFSLRYLVSELFGGADDKSQFVMISDGGHFENLGVYELVRRRCRVIIASDAECDPHLALDGLGTLIRMCEVDFGATITIQAGPIRTGGAPPDDEPDAPAAAWSRSRFAVGTIDYGGKAPNGVLIYMKASMTGEEDTAVMQYKATHPAFPHESTGDQFYGEDQFESYRRLGRDVARTAFERLGTQPDMSKWQPT